MLESNHLLLDQGYLSMILEHLNQGLATYSSGIRLPGELDAHVSSQFVDPIELCLRKVLLVVL